MEPVTTVLSLLNETFTLAQTISGLASAPQEVQSAIKFIWTIQAKVQRAKHLRNRVFDVLSPDTARDATFISVQDAIREADAAVTASSLALVGTKKKDKTNPGSNSASKSSKAAVRVRFSWVAGGRQVYDGNLQELQVANAWLIHATGLLERRLESRGVVVRRDKLPFGEWEDGDDDGGKGGTDTTARLGDEISMLIGPRRSRELLLQGDGEVMQGGNDSGIGSLASSGGSSADSDNDDDYEEEEDQEQDKLGQGFRRKSDFTVVVLEPEGDDSKVDDLFLERLRQRQRQS
ncbi:hypothetical protein QBC42DRAFT_18615 [Cladorrhinum samala]|uniref:Uncharacterized protein n=1 Tax=Cladorrhinum samala TaxID=585594 RepID=A0AAV9I0P5_9PEZI|nr:hypothetical protein QBC42DRAFT_18615 [Cladorrhinum samala]